MSDFFSAWQDRIQATASQETRMAGYLDGMTLGNPSFFVRHLGGKDLQDYYDGLREGLKSFYRPEAWTPKLSAAYDPWADEMIFEARDTMTDEDRQALPHIPGWGRVLAPHAVPTSSPYNPKHVINPHATEFSRLHPEEQERQLAKVHGHAPEGVDLSHEGIVNRLVALHHHYAHGTPLGEGGGGGGKLFDPDTEKTTHQYHAGGNFYHEANELTSKWAEHPHLVGGRQKRRQATAGILSALSPGTEWENNKSQAQHFIENHHHFDHLDPWEAAGKYWKGLGNSKRQGFTRNTQSNYAKAFEMARSGHPDDHLGGHKVRSFYNAVIDPKNRSGRNDVVMDRHAVSAAVGGTMDEHRLNPLFYGYRHKDRETGEITAPAIGSSKKHNTIGTYAHFADAYREAHRRLTEAGEDAGAHPAEFQAKVGGVWRDKASGNAKKNPVRRNMPHYSIAQSTEINDFGEPIDTWGGPDDEPDPDLDPRGHDDYWQEHYERGHHQAARTNRSASETGADFGVTPEISQQGYEPDPDKDWTPDGGHAVFGSMMPHHLNNPDFDEWGLCVEGVLEVEPQAALPWTEATEPEPVAHQDAQPRTDRSDVFPYQSQTMAAAQATCQHCQRRITRQPDGSWIDPHATGDDSIWRETCDSHDTFAAEHEPHIGGDRDRKYQPFRPDTEIPHHHLNNLHQAEYEESHEGNPHPSDWWQQEHSTGAANPASTGPENFGAPLDPADYPLMHGQENPDEHLLDPTGVPLSSSNFGANFEFNGSVQNEGLDRFRVGLGGHYGPAPSLRTAVPDTDLYPTVEAGSQGMGGPPRPDYLGPATAAAGSQPSTPGGGRDWLMKGVQPGAPAPGQATAESSFSHTAQARSGLESYVAVEQDYMAGGEVQLPPGVSQPEWVMRGGGRRSPGNSDIAMAARSHLASLSISEQHELINEGADDGRRASNYDRLRLAGTHYEVLERELASRDTDAEDLFL